MKGSANSSCTTVSHFPRYMSQITWNHDVNFKILKIGSPSTGLGKLIVFVLNAAITKH